LLAQYPDSAFSPHIGVGTGVVGIWWLANPAAEHKIKKIKAKSENETLSGSRHPSQ
jgi:hypothetical protein